jgi:hypothetical protein
MTTLRSVIAHLATMIRYAGIAYIVVQVAIWHSFYAQSPWRAAAPALAVAWAVAAALHMRRRQPPELLTWADTAAYLAFALAAQGGVPPEVRDSAFSWLVIAMSGQLIVPAWFAPGPLAALLALASPLAYRAAAPAWSCSTLTSATEPPRIATWAPAARRALRSSSSRRPTVRPPSARRSKPERGVTR